jgi:hypothetical protein
MVDIDELQREMEMKYRRDLNLKLEEINSYLETQAFARDQLDTSRTEIESKLSADRRRLEVGRNKWGCVRVIVLD